MSNSPYYSILLVSVYFVFICLSCSQGDDPFAETKESKNYTFSVQDAFKVIAEENDRTRALYTKKIVGQGQQIGLDYDENWQEEDVEAGPLPALFLRATSETIQKDPTPLGLYLGSDFPIRSSNKFTGIQSEKFVQIRKDSQAQFFYDEVNQLHIAMFPDLASVAACVSCHNEHPESTKTDWKLNDIMGATTWTYPNDSLTTTEMLKLVKAYRHGVEVTYNAYLEEVHGFKLKEMPEIGKKWADQGYAIPDITTFLNEVQSINTATMNKILEKI